MAQPKKVFVCGNCGYESPKWSGKCPECGAWNSFEELVIQKSPAGGGFTPAAPAQRQLLSEIKPLQEPRVQTGMAEFDRVLGGGIFPASVVLLAGDPGIGKSTLLLQVAGRLTGAGVPVVYVSGEESLRQVGNRAERLGVSDLPVPILVETELESVLARIEQEKPSVVIIDSIQALFSRDVSGAPGNLSQVRECASRLFRAAKEQGWSLFLIGHITKEGGIAGPKILEHMVDVVISFEGDNFNQYRILRSLKNRFGNTNELGLFLMDSRGLQPVENPSRLFLSNQKGAVVGTSVVCSFEGSRPILAEVQALVARSNYGVPQRTVSGFDQRRLALLLAILEKHAGLNFGYSDVFVKIAGGLRIDDPGIDLGIATALYSSFTETPPPDRSVFIGEIGLNGDVRPVARLDKRIQEAGKLGFRAIYIPEIAAAEAGRLAGKKLALNPVRNIAHLLNGKFAV